MKLRCDLHLNGGHRRLLLVPAVQEKSEHIALKLAAFLCFWDLEPIAGASPKHPALVDQEFLPDLMGLDAGGSIRLWVECGKVAMHKMDKVVRRFPGARVVVFKASEAEARRLREDLRDKVDRSGRVEILAWPPGRFAEWTAAIAERTEVFGEADGRSLNVVINQRPFVVDLASF